MKKLLCLLMALLLATQLLGCNVNKQKNVQSTVNFYYTTTDVTYHDEEGLISPEKRSVNQSPIDLPELLNLYLKGPESDDYITPFPKNTFVQDVEHKSGIVAITLSNEFAELHNFDLSVACACLTLTVQQFVETNLIQIGVDGVELDGNKYITMNTDSLVLYDDAFKTIR